MRVAIVWAFCPVTWDVLVAFLRVVCEYLAEYYWTNIYEKATLMTRSGWSVAYNYFWFSYLNSQLVCETYYHTSEKLSNIYLETILKYNVSEKMLLHKMIIFSGLFISGLSINSRCKLPFHFVSFFVFIWSPLSSQKLSFSQLHFAKMYDFLLTLNFSNIFLRWEQ